MNIIPVILSGGSGTRLWPMSRETQPKQFLNLLDNSSLITHTVARLDKIDSVAASISVTTPIVVCNEYHRFKVAQHISEANRWPCDVILEPCARNTAPAIAAAAFHAVHNAAEESDTLLLVMPADHIIQDEEAFAKAVMEMAEVAAAGNLVTFGITPETAATGYGYICAGDALSGSSARTITAFVEKPDRVTAERYVAAKNYFWNSGIFLFSARSLLQELEQHAPDIFIACADSYKTAKQEGSFLKLGSKSFSVCRSESIDYAVMERTSRAVVRPVSMGWSDIGSWESLWEVHPKDDGGNAITGSVVNVDCENNYLRAGDRTLAVLGVKDLVVVDTDDALLIVHRSRSEEVKTLLQHVAALEPEKATQHRTVQRPWGSYRSMDAADRFQVKRISVNPGAQLSLQMHHHRAEHWVVVHGTAVVTIEDKVFVLKENESTYIPIGAKHRLENPGRIPLELIEVQSGSYLGEDDIVRYDDVYGRETPQSNVVNM